MALLNLLFPRTTGFQIPYERFAGGFAWRDWEGLVFNRAPFMAFDARGISFKKRDGNYDFEPKSEILLSTLDAATAAAVTAIRDQKKRRVFTVSPVQGTLFGSLLLMHRNDLVCNVSLSEVSEGLLVEIPLPGLPIRVVLPPREN